MNIEIFPCSGGMSEGFRRAGIEFDMAIDYDADACDSHEKNLGLRPLQMDVRDFLRLLRLGWRPAKRVRLIVADPPCTPWSRAGKREGLADDRDCLRETAEIIAILQPDFYLIGNVPGLQDATSWHVVQDVIGGLGKHGYCVADYAQLDAADYGVPQHRIRPFWFGHRIGTACIRWPERTHAAPGAPTLPGVAPLQPWVTCRQALQHLPPDELGRPVRMKWKDGFNGPNHRPSKSDEPAKALTRNTHSDGVLLAMTDEMPRAKRPPSTKGPQWSRVANVDEPSPTILTDTDRATGNMVKLGLPIDGRGTDVRHPSSDADAPSRTIKTNSDRIGSGAALAWPWERPATTVYEDERLAPPGRRPAEGIGSVMSSPNAIVLGERAAAILQGFPDGWVFAGATKKARWSQIGMAMPPPLAHAVARAVREAIERAEKEAAA